jgi:lipopolysaccharide transport system ATP-binding protein
MSEIVIRCDGLSKEYRIGERHSYKALRDVIADAARAPFRRFRTAMRNGNANSGATNHHSALNTHDSNRFWALDDVSFAVERGDVVGIIGRNGAGKSTLLKLLSRITKPTKGHAEIHGRVGSLLEVGTGFHPELSGRENIYLNAAILGMRRAEVERKFDEIVAFAEVEQFIDTPVKRYSSGMYVRLAFAVAAHMETEILIVDEVLAVGDAEFQRKCLGKMGEAARGGRTVLFVSHNMQAISTLTTRCLLLRDGRAVLQDQPSNVIAAYLEDGLSSNLVYSALPSQSIPSVTRVEALTSEPNNTQSHGKSVSFAFDLSIPHVVRSASFSFQIMDSMKQPIVHLWLLDSEKPWCHGPGTYRLICTVPNLRLYLGRYSITTHLSEGEMGSHFQTLDGVCPFEVVMFGNDRGWRWQEGACKYLEEGSWTVNQLASSLSWS